MRWRWRPSSGIRLPLPPVPSIASTYCFALLEGKMCGGPRQGWAVCPLPGGSPQPLSEAPIPLPACVGVPVPFCIRAGSPSPLAPSQVFPLLPLPFAPPLELMGRGAGRSSSSAPRQAPPPPLTAV